MEREYQHLLFKKHWILTSVSEFLLGQCDSLVEAIKNTPIMPSTYDDLMHVSLIKGAQATTAIEGNTLTDEEIEGLILRDEKMPPSKEYQQIEVENIIDAFNTLLDEVVGDDNCSLITTELLLRFHQIVGKNLGEHFDAIPGRLRENNVVVGKYRCPDPKDVPELLNTLCEWIKHEFAYNSGNQSFKDVVVQAIVTHIYIEWIHPFGDGNGRTGRLVEFYILLRGGNPDIASHILSNHYNQTRSNYYRQIELATQTKDLSKFIEYALQGFKDGLMLTLKSIQATQLQNFWQKLIYDKFHDVQMVKRDVFKRQRTLALELPTNRTFSILQVPELSMKLARLYSVVSERTIHRDIEKLIELELVEKIHGGYRANISLLNRMIARKKKNTKETLKKAIVERVI
jgi:Fic family protein